MFSKPLQQALYKLALISSVASSMRRSQQLTKALSAPTAAKSRDNLLHDSHFVRSFCGICVKTLCNLLEVFTSANVPVKKE
jgi:hypothetical protein